MNLYHEVHCDCVEDLEISIRTAKVRLAYLEGKIQEMEEWVSRQPCANPFKFGSLPQNPQETLKDCGECWPCKKRNFRP